MDADTEAIIKLGLDNVCQFAVAKYQQMDGLNTALPIGTRKIDIFRTLTTESVAGFVPFKVQEIQEPGGIYFGAKGIRTHIFADEFHIAYENEYSGKFFTSAWRQFRKRNASPCAITQNVEYLLDSVQASTMLSNSEFIIMLNQAESDQERLARLLNHRYSLLLRSLHSRNPHICSPVHNSQSRLSLPLLLCVISKAGMVE